MARNTTDTPVQGFDRPAVGDDWAVSWDELVETLDEKVVSRGLESNRPSSGNYDNQLYLATDTQTLYRWDSGTASWNQAISIDKITGTISPSSTNTTESPSDDVNSVRVEPDGTTTIDLSSTTTIDDASSKPQLQLTSDNESVTLIYNGSNDDWEVF